MPTEERLCNRDLRDRPPIQLDTSGLTSTLGSLIKTDLTVGQLYRRDRRCLEQQGFSHHWIDGAEEYRHFPASYTGHRGIWGTARCRVEQQQYGEVISRYRNA